MQPRDALVQGGIVLVVALVVGTVFAVPVLSDTPSTVGGGLTIESHQPASILATSPNETGSVSVSSPAGSKHVVIDAGHGNRLERSSLSPLIAALTSAGHTVTFYHGQRETSLNASLRSADAVVVIEPQRSYTAAQRRGLDAFAEAGGRILLAGEPPSQGASILSVLGVQVQQSGGTAPFTGLASSFGFAIGDGYVYDLETYDINYRNPYASPTAAIGGSADQITLHEATTVTGGRTLLETSATSQVSSARTKGARPVAARNGNVTVLGDASLLDQEWVLRKDNEIFVSGVIEFLVSGQKQPGVPAPPTSSGGGSPRSPSGSPGGPQR